MFCREFRERRKQNSIKNGLNQQHHRVKKSRRVRTQHTFYPCPPPTASELDIYESDSDDEFIDYNAVSKQHVIILIFLLHALTLFYLIHNKKIFFFYPFF